MSHKLLVFAFSLLAASLAAETVEQLVEEALCSNCSMQAAHQAWEAAQRELSASLGLFSPELSFEAGRHNEDLNVRTDDYNYGYLEARWNLYRGGRDNALLQEACLRQRVAELELCALRQRLAYDIYAVAWNLAFLGVKAEIHEQARQRLAHIRTISERKVEAGVATELDNALLSAWESQLSIAIAGLHNQQQQELFQLGALAGRDCCDSAPCLEGLPPSLCAPDDCDPCALAQEAYCKRYDYLLAEARIQLANTEQSYAFGRALPSVDLLATYGKEPDDPGDRGTGTKITLSVSVPIFSGFRHYNRGQSACHVRLQTMAEAETLRRQIDSELQRLMSQLAFIEQALEVQTRTQEEAQTIRQLSSEQYQKGISSVGDLLAAESTLLQQSLELASLRQARELTLLELARARGCFAY